MIREKPTTEALRKKFTKMKNNTKHRQELLRMKNILLMVHWINALNAVLLSNPNPLPYLQRLIQAC